MMNKSEGLYMRNLTKKGLTLIEIMVTLTIMAIFVAVVSPFLFSNYKALKYSDVRMELQREGDKIIEELTNKALQAESIEYIRDYKGNKINLNTNKNANISIIKFKGINRKRLKCEFKIKDSSNNESSIKYIKINSLPLEVNFNKTKGIYVKIGLEKRRIEKELRTKVYFRNGK